VSETNNDAQQSKTPAHKADLMVLATSNNARYTS